MSDNSQALKFLEYFCDSANRFDFAILIDGAWGAGKTYIVKELMEKIKSDTGYDKALKRKAKILYISMFGVRSVDDLKNLIIAESSPVLSSPLAKAVGSIFVGALSTVTAGISPSTALGELRKWVTNIDADFIFFDDFERSILVPEEALGFISTLINAGSTKIIVISNEKEIKKSNIELYNAQKEKVIGKTLTVRSATIDVFRQFSKVRDVKLSEFYKKHEISIIRTFDSSGYANFRSLKCAIDDFERIIKEVDGRLWASDMAAAFVLLEVIALTMEAKVDNSSGKIEDMVSQAAGTYIPSKSKEKIDDVVLKKYKMIDWADLVIPASVVAEMISSGRLDVSKADEAVGRHRLIVGEQNVPSWRRLWRWWGLDRRELDACVRTLKVDLSNNEFKHPAEILHIYGMGLSLKNYKYEIYPKFEKYMRSYFMKVIAKDGFILDFGVFKSIPDSYFGLMYHGRDLEEFHYFKDFIYGEMISILPKICKIHEAEIFSEIWNPLNKQSFGDHVPLFMKYGRTLPILKGLDPQKLADITISGGIRELKVLEFLNDRYFGSEGRLLLEGEGEFVLKYCDSLEKKVKKLQNPYKSTWSEAIGARLAAMRERIETSVMDLPP